MDLRKITALSLGVIYLGACVWALFNRLDAILLFAVVSPVAASLFFPKESGVVSRMFVGAVIDGLLAALAFVPVLGDFVDGVATVVAVVLVVARFRQLIISLPGGLACLVLYGFLWSEAGLLPDRFSLTGGHHGLGADLTVVPASVLAGGALLAATAWLLGVVYKGDRARAIFSAAGFPWFLITFFVTIFLPHRDVERAHQAADLTRCA